MRPRALNQDLVEELDTRSRIGIGPKRMYDLTEARIRARILFDRAAARGRAPSAERWWALEEVRDESDKRVLRRETSQSPA